MQHPGFFRRAGPFSLSEIARATQAEISDPTMADRRLEDVRALQDAESHTLTFLDNRKYVTRLQTTRAGACLIAPGLVPRVPPPVIPLITKAPYMGFALALRLFYPEALWSMTAPARQGTLVDPTADLEEGVVVEPGAVIGPEARIGRGTRIAAGAVIGTRVYVGRDTFIGPQVTLIHALVGDRVIVHSGARIGQDGFGFVMTRNGHFKVPQIGRVVIQDDVEIGANSTIDRGALRDTIIGEGTKIDNLVQIGHNAIIGRHCVIVGQSGIAGSAELGDFVVMGGHAGVSGHIKIGAGAQLAGDAHAIKDVPPGVRMGGTPAKPLRQFVRELAFVERGAKRPWDKMEPSVETESEDGN